MCQLHTVFDDSFNLFQLVSVINLLSFLQAQVIYQWITLKRMYFSSASMV